MNTTELAIEDFRHRLELIEGALVDYMESGLQRKTILVLLQHKTKLSMRTIDTVLCGLETLDEDYFNPEPE